MQPDPAPTSTPQARAGAPSDEEVVLIGRADSHVPAAACVEIVEEGASPAPEEDNLRVASEAEQMLDRRMPPVQKGVIVAVALLLAAGAAYIVNYYFFM